MDTGRNNHTSRLIPHSRPTITTEDLSAAEQVLRSEMIAAGTTVKTFEESLCSYIGGKSAIATASGKAALVMALSIIGIGRNDEVIVPTYVCRSVMDAILFVGATPVLADIGEDYCISPEDLERRISKRTKAIIVVHIFGVSARISDILDRARKDGIRLIEDCAQSIGGQLNGKKLGSFADLSFFSFHATKVMTTGEGGMVVVNAPDLIAASETTRQKMGPFFGINDLQAALGLSQLGRLPEFVAKRRALAQEYLRQLVCIPNLMLPISDLNKSMFFRFPVRTRLSFDGLRAELEQKGIQIRKGVDSMLHQYRPGGCFPRAERLFQETVSLPIYPMLDIPDIEIIVSHIRTAAQNGQ